MTWTFESLGERTRVTITAENVPSSDQRDLIKGVAHG